MGKCSICGKKGLLLGTNKCFSCGKEICTNCSGDPFFSIEASSDPNFSVHAYFTFQIQFYSCSDDCRNSFKSFMVNRDFGKTAGTTLDDRGARRCFNTLCDAFISEKQPGLRSDIRESTSYPSIYRIYLRAVKGSPAFDSIYKSFEREWHLGLAKNLEQVGRYIDAANVFESKLRDYESARKVREKDRSAEIVSTEVPVDLDALLKQFKDSEMIAIYRCPHCGGKLKISKDTTLKSLRNCEHCTSQIEIAEMGDFLRTALS